MLFKDILDIADKIIVILGVPFAIYQYAMAKKKERRDREYGTYDALDEKYIEFQQLCLKYPNLDIFDIPDKSPPNLDEKSKKEELIIFTILFSIFERAYLLYSDESSQLKKKQWWGWDEYIKAFSKRQNFKTAWNVSGKTFDTTFQEYMSENLA